MEKHLRCILDKQFDKSLPPEEQDIFEDIFEEVPYWKKPGDFFTDIWQKQILLIFKIWKMMNSKISK